MSSLALDHVFWTVSRGAREEARFFTESRGFVESYRRRHSGQGTSNVCYAFDNAYLELLWLEDRAEAESLPIARTGLSARTRSAVTGANPFGIAFRVTGGDGLVAPCWAYRPPYLPPDGPAIDIAVECDDVEQPLIFRSPGTAPPRDWPAERRGELQRAAGFGEISVLYTPSRPPGPALLELRDAGVLDLEPVRDEPALSLVLQRGDDNVRVDLPLDM